MGSRIRSNPKHIFDAFLEVAPSQNESEKPWVLQTYPASYKDKETETVKSVPQFTFPCKFPITCVQHFSFVLTNLEAKWTFGFCRYAPNGSTALVFLSSLPWHEFFYKLLNLSAELTQAPDSGELWRFLEGVYRSPLPHPGLTYSLEYGVTGQVFTSPTPNHLNLPSIPENRNLTEYYNAVGVNNMITIFASMLYERRIIVTSKKLSVLSACVQAANLIIYPMSWQHIFIPVLPVQLMDYLCAPMPFLIGVPEPIMKRTRASELGDVVVVYADENRIDTPFDDLDSLPAEVIANLKKCLKPPASMLGENVARAFLQALVHLIGGYRDALKYRQGEKITFNEDAFILSRSSSIQPFLEKMLQLQIFMQFIEERLELLNSGKGFSDEFELECVVFTEKSNKKFKNQYAAITQNVKRESGAFVKKVKNKTNPAMKDAVKNVLEGGKSAKDKMGGAGKVARTKAKATYKDVKSRLKENREEIKDDGPHSLSAPSSPVPSRSSTLNRYGTMNNAQFPRQHTDLTFSRVLKYERFDPNILPGSEEVSPEMEEIPKLNIDLMTDLDEILNRNRKGSNNSQSKVMPSSHDLPGPSSRKSSVGDLINLNNEDDEVVFDPLASSSAVKPELGAGGHRKLSRSSNPRLSQSNLSNVPSTNISGQSNFSNSSIPSSVLSGGMHKSSYDNNNSTGKYENYVPAGGSSQHQFREFVNSMNSSSSNQKPQEISRSSDDLLSEYGLNFSKMSMHNMATPSPQTFLYHQQPKPYTQQQIQHQNSYHYMPPHLRQTNPVSNGVGASAAPVPPPRALPGTKNTSFLYNSPAVPISMFAPVESTYMPVNQRLMPSEPESAGISSTRDILADLDPLRKPALERTSHSSPVHSAINQVDLGPVPPAVPPRSKKQWTTFE